MKGKGSLGAIGAMLLAFLGFFRRGCDDVARVASDIPYNQLDEFPMDAFEQVTRFNDRTRFMRPEADFRRDYFQANNIVESKLTAAEAEAAFEAAYAAEKQEVTEFLRLTARRKNARHGKDLVNGLENISKRANGVICIREDGAINVTYTMPMLGTAQLIGGGVSLNYHLVDSVTGATTLGPDCLYKQGICFTLKNGKVDLDRSRTIECDYGSLTVGGSYISLSSDTETLQLPVQIGL